MTCKQTEQLGLQQEQARKGYPKDTVGDNRRPFWSIPAIDLALSAALRTAVRESVERAGPVAYAK